MTSTTLSFIDQLFGAGGMRIYKLTYVGRGAVQETTWIKASDEAEAVALLGIPRQRVKAISRDFVRELNDRLPQSQPKLTLQARILAVFAAQVSAGANPSSTLDRLLASFPVFKDKMTEVLAVQRVSDKLKILNFDPQLQLLAEVGEESGLIGDVMRGAAAQIIERHKMLSDVRNKMIPSIMIAVAGLLTMMILPIYMTEPIDSIQGARGIKMTTNVSTDIMMFLGYTYEQALWWYVTGGALVGAYLSKSYWWAYLRKVPGLDKIEEFFRLQNSYRFISAFLPLFSRGVSMGNAIALLRRFAKGKEGQVFQNMEIHLTTGGSISNAFEGEYWDPMLRDCMRGFDQMRQDHKIDLLQRIQPLMAQEMMNSANSVSGAIGLAGLLLSVAVTLIVFMGLTLPLMTVSTAL